MILSIDAVKTYDKVKLYYFKCLFIFEREREKVSGGGANREARITSGPCTASTEPDAGLNLMICEIMT